jgi:7-carboxy-7-deazaguanine synthase
MIMGDRYPLMEKFYTLQGEGFYSGQAAYFIRLGGCDVGCVWCDVKDSWDASAHPLVDIDEIINDAKASGAEFCVITGGEPLMHNLDNLTKAIHDAGMRAHIETSGSSPMSGSWDWICLSPKKFKAPLPECIGLADELKIIIYHKSDFEWAESFAQRVKPGCKLFLQPEWGKSESMLPLIIAYIKQNPQWQLSLQIHKFLQIP